MKDERYEQIKTLAKTVQSRLAEAQKANDEAEVLIDRIDELRSELAAEWIERKLKIKPGMYIKGRDGLVYRVDSLGADSLSTWHFEPGKSLAKIVGVERMFAQCTRINKGTGTEQRRKGGRYGRKAAAVTARVQLSDQTPIVPESEVLAKRQKNERSDAVKAFAKLTPMEQRAALDAIAKARK